MIKHLRLSTYVMHWVGKKERCREKDRDGEQYKKKRRNSLGEKRCEKEQRKWGRWRSLQWLVWDTRGAPMSLRTLPRTPLLPSVCVKRRETDEGFTVGSWLVHIPGVVFLPSAPWPYQRPLKQQAVRLWQLASNSSYSSPEPRFPASPRSCAPIVICVCVCVWASG